MLASAAARVLPSDFVVATQAGGVFTLLAYTAMFVVFVCEVMSFLTSSHSTVMMLDHHSSEYLQLNFDVDLYDIECRNLKVVVYAQSSKERTSTWAQDFWLRSIDAKGRAFGMAIKPDDHTEEEIRGETAHQALVQKLVQEEGQAELDADWSNSHDGFRHSSFEHIVQAHDFTFINFFAGWCGHCQQFAPLWAAIAQKVNGDENTPSMKFKDRDAEERSVRMIKMNCVDFAEVCHQQGIDAYPTLRMYKADGTFSVYEGKRDEAEIIRWIERLLKMKSYGWSKDHETFEKGCNAKGRLVVPRVPGHLELMMGGGDQNLNTRMTNVSHFVRHLSFSDPNDGKFHRKTWAGMPRDVVRHTAPIDGTAFITGGAHQTWIHDMKVVSTVSSSGLVAYQFHHTRRLSSVAEDVVPQVQFFFDMEPFSIHIRNDDKRWYEFATSLMAIMGGCFVVMRLMTGISNTALASLRSLLPRGGSSGGSALYVKGRYD
mmetsp:Transcript_75994/g.220722  ORF Transcript_75994/g.220722 Transcript_75994/m.220722 type:complete len:486 (+) Transcript_75994:99-1556(+)